VGKVAERWEVVGKEDLAVAMEAFEYGPELPRAPSADLGGMATIPARQITNNMLLHLHGSRTAHLPQSGKAKKSMAGRIGEGVVDVCDYIASLDVLSKASNAVKEAVGLEGKVA